MSESHEAKYSKAVCVEDCQVNSCEDEDAEQLEIGSSERDVDSCLNENGEKQDSTEMSQTNDDSSTIQLSENQTRVGCVDELLPETHPRKKDETSCEFEQGEDDAEESMPHESIERSVSIIIHHDYDEDNEDGSVNEVIEDAQSSDSDRKVNCDEPYNMDTDNERIADELSHKTGQESETLSTMQTQTNCSNDRIDQFEGIDVICGSCHQHFNSIASLAEHLSTSHPSPLPSTTNIEVIQDELSDPNMVDNISEPRTEDINLNESANQCKNCTKTFVSARILQRHRKMCKKVQNSLKVKQKPLVTSLSMSSRDITSESLTCSICEKVFSQGNALEIHMKMHHTNGTFVNVNVIGDSDGEMLPFEESHDLPLNKGKKQLQVVLGQKLARKKIENNIGIGKVLKENENSLDERFRTCVECEEVFSNRNSLLKHILKMHSKNIKAESHSDEENMDFSQSNITFDDLHEIDWDTTQESDNENDDALNLLLKNEYKSNTVVVITDTAEDKEHYLVNNKGKKLVECSLCSKQLSSRHSLMEHMRTHTGERPFQCGDCGRAFTTPRNLKKHHQSVHSGLKPFTCNECGKSFPLKSSLKAHSQFHTGKFRYRCPTCNKGFQTPAALRRHEITHTDERPYACDQCDKRFNDSSALSKHLFYHTGQKPHVCAECGKAFASISTLKAHNLTHTGVSAFLCQECGKYFRTKSSLHRHSRIHTGQKPFECDLCERDFMERWQLVSHRRSHTGETPFECTECGKKFVSNRKLTRHLRTHNPSYLCTFCGKGFTTSSFLKIHMYKHTGEHPFHCTECSKRFATHALLKRHMLTHTGIKPYVCDTCGKCFTTLIALKNHTSLHTGIRPFVCDHCGKGFPSKTALKIHSQFHSAEKPFECEDCGKKFHRVYELNHHRIIHSEVKPFKCELCDKAYHHKSGLDAHVNTHTEEIWYPCDECDKKFLREATLRKHRKIHAVIKPHTCAVCSRGFARKEHLKRHFLTHEGKEIPTHFIEVENGIVEPESVLVLEENAIVEEHIEMIQS